jgi:hypothetical protein
MELPMIFILGLVIVMVATSLVGEPFFGIGICLALLLCRFCMCKMLRAIERQYAARADYSGRN